MFVCYKDVVINKNNQYEIIKRERQPKDDEYGTLKRIKKVLQRELQYNILSHDKYSQMQDAHRRDYLAKLAESHTINYLKRLQSAPERKKSRSVFNSYNRKEKATKKAYADVFNLTADEPALFLVNDITQLVLSHLSIIDIAKYACVNRRAQAQAKIALFSNAQQLGFEIKDADDAARFFALCSFALNKINKENACPHPLEYEYPIQSTLERFIHLRELTKDSVVTFETLSGKKLDVALPTEIDYTKHQMTEEEAARLTNFYDSQKDLCRLFLKSFLLHDIKGMEAALLLELNPNHYLINSIFTQLSLQNFFQAKKAGIQCTPLHWAVHNAGNSFYHKKSLEIVQLLLKYGANPNALCGNHRSPLNDSLEVPNFMGPLAEKKLFKVVEALLLAGADPTYTPPRGLSPLKRAQKLGYKKIAALLQHYIDKR